MASRLSREAMTRRSGVAEIVGMELEIEVWDIAFKINKDL
jgi:hypothetical protein